MSSSPRLNLSPPIDKSVNLLIEGAIEQAICPPHVAVVTSIPFRAFVNRLKVLPLLDFDELVDAHVLGSHAEWLRFERDPIRWLSHASDIKAAALWTLLEAHQPAELRATPAVQPNAPAQIGEAA